MLDRYMITFQHLTHSQTSVIDPPRLEPWETAELLECQPVGGSLRLVWAIRSARSEDPMSIQKGVAGWQSPATQPYDGDPEAWKQTDIEAQAEIAELREQIARLVAEKQGWEADEAGDGHTEWTFPEGPGEVLGEGEE